MIARSFTTRLMVPGLIATAMVAAVIHGPGVFTAGEARLESTTLCTTEPAAGPYVTGFDHDASRAVWTVGISDPGTFDIGLKYRTRFGKKSAVVRAGGSAFEAALLPSETFRSDVVGRAEFGAGPVEIAVEKGDGFFDLSELAVTPTPPAPVVKPNGIPCDPAASPEARALLKSLCGGMGDVTLSGGYGDADEKLILALTGRRPAIFGADLMDYSPSRIEHGQKPGPAMDGLIRRSRGGQVVTLSWHWNAPSGLVDKVVTGKDGKPQDLRWYRGFYTDATTFDVAAAMADPSSKSYQLLLRDIDAIAVPLKQLDDAHVPVLWRPLHEAEGKWFWWGAKGPDPFKKLWRLTYDRLVRVHGLHNLVWVFTDDTDPAWYPGDDVVDVIGIDAYPRNPHDVMAGRWIDLSTRYAGRKLIALTECRGIPDVPAMYRLRCPWAYFVSWTGPEGPVRNPPGEVKAAYQDPHVRSLGPG